MSDDSPDPPSSHTRRVPPAGPEGELASAGEALAVLFGTGRSDDRATALRLLAERPLSELGLLSPRELVELGGLTLARARRLAAAFALGRCLAGVERARRPTIRGPEAALRVVRPLFDGREEEVFLALLLDAKHRLRRVVQVSQGTLTSSLVHPREVFRAAVRERAAAVLVAHNHPSLDPRPSAEDLAVTRRLFDAGRLLGVPLLDHVVVGGTRHVSIRQRHGLPPRARGGAAADSAAADPEASAVSPARGRRRPDPGRTSAPP